MKHQNADWATREAVLIWVHAGYTRRQISKGMGLPPSTAYSITRSATAVSMLGDMEGRCQWFAGPVEGFGMTRSFIEEQAARCWAAAGYSPEQIAAGMGLPMKKVGLILRGRSFSESCDAP